MSALHDKVALVTGSSRGIGAAIARLFAREGAKVVVHGRDQSALAAVQADIVRAGGRAIQVAADTTSFAEIEAMRRQTEQELGPIDVLVANAGGSFTKPGPLEETSEEGWHTSLDNNLTATFLTIKEAQQQALVEQHPIRRLGTPEDVAAAALFLASDNAAWITGIVVDVAGGSVLA